MPLFFDDFLEASDCSGLYTLMGYVNGTWQDIHTIYGPSTGSIEVDASFNAIEVDTTLFIPGGTYQFKWVDGNGVPSNIITLTIPVESGSGSGSGSPGAASVSIVDAEIDRVDVQASGLAFGEQAVIEVYCTTNGVTTTSVSQGYVNNSVFTFTNSDFVAGSSIYAALIGSGWTVLSQTVTIPGADSYPSSGSGSNPFSVMITSIDAGNLFAQVFGDITTVPGYNPGVPTYATIYFSPTGSGDAFQPYTASAWDQSTEAVGQTGWDGGNAINFNPAQLVPGNDYEVVITNSNTVMATSTVVTLPSIDSGSSSGGSGSDSGSGAAPYTVTITNIIDENLFGEVSGDISTVSGFDPTNDLVAYLYYRPTGIGAFALWTAGLNNTSFPGSYQGEIAFNPAGIASGNDYQIIITSDGAMIASSQPVTVSDTGSNSSSASGSGMSSASITLESVGGGDTNVVSFVISASGTGPSDTIAMYVSQSGVQVASGTMTAPLIGTPNNISLMDGSGSPYDLAFGQTYDFYVSDTTLGINSNVYTYMP